AFLYSVVTLTFRNYSSFAGGINRIGELIRTGEMDSYLLTPLNPLFLITSRNTMVWRAFYNIGILLLTVYCGLRAGILVTIHNIVMFIVMMASAMFVLFAVYLIIYTFSFYVVEVKAAADITEEILKKYMIYPINIYGSAAGFIFTFILPLGFASYYPSAYLLGKTQEFFSAGFLGGLLPAVSLIWLALALIFWSRSLRRYESTGS
ncbi:MAG: ABC transporter permease, partial [Oscillospiraceae bacterium]|nr:ABC transporter permease [Oscillospiraceae bacterium]